MARVKNWVRRISVGIITMVVGISVFAGTQPKFTIIPSTPNNINLRSDQLAAVSYQVTNQTALTRTLTMVPISGVSQITTGPQACSNPFTLASKQSCNLNLIISGPQLTGSITNGPIICKTIAGGGNFPDAFLCSKPSDANSLNVTLTYNTQPILSISPTSLVLNFATGNGIISVTNTSDTLTALNVSANLAGTALAGNVIQNASGCVTLSPRQTCNLIFTPGMNAVPPTFVPIAGTNTPAVGATITINPPPVIPLQITSVLPVNLLTYGASASVTIQNNSPTQTATNILPDLSNPALSSVSVSANTCNSVLPGASCTITFSSATTTSIPLLPTNVPIAGFNTTSVNAPIQINEGRAYVTNFSANTISLCQINNADGSFINPCLANVSGLFNQPNDIILNQAGNIAYIANRAGNNILSCDVTVTGTLINCADTGAVITLPTSVTLNIDESLMYINQDANNIIYCQVNGHNLSNCSIATPTNAETANITFTANGLQAYVALYNSSAAAQYTVGNTGLLTLATTTTGFNLVSGVTLTPAENKLYVTNNGSNIVNLCTLPLPNGPNTNCINSGAAFSGFGHVVLNFTNTLAYVPGAISTTVAACQVNADSTLTPCDVFPNVFSNPSGIFLK